MSDGMGREPAYLSSHATNRYFIPNWGNKFYDNGEVDVANPASDMGRVITDKDLAEHDYNPWNPEKW